MTALSNPKATCYQPSSRETLEWLRNHKHGRITLLALFVLAMLAFDSVSMRGRISAIENGGYWHPSYDYIKGN
jgi:hypothetical protein